MARGGIKSAGNRPKRSKSATKNRKVYGEESKEGKQNYMAAILRRKNRRLAKKNKKK